MKTKKPASRCSRFPLACLNDFCFYLGLDRQAPRTEEAAIHLGRNIAVQWANYPRALQSAENSRSSLEHCLNSLPDDSRELAIAEAMVRGMFLDVPRALVQNTVFHSLVCGFRHCLIRTPEQHLAAICQDLGVGVPKSNSESQRMGARVVESFQQPIHAYRMVQRREAIYHSLRSLPEGSREHKMAKALVIKATNKREVPEGIQRKNDYRQVAETLRQALKLG